MDLILNETLIQLIRMENQEQPQPSEQLHNNNQIQLKRELLAMEFEPALVDQALAQTNDLEAAIAWIISALEQADQQATKEQGVSLWLLVRTDLKMGMGKVAAQCAHATLKAFIQGRQRAQSDDSYSFDFINWLERGQPQTILKVENEQQLFELLGSSRQTGASTCYIRDAGRTQIAAGSATVGAIGPSSNSQLRTLLRSLQPL